MATHGMSRLAVLVLLGALIVAPTGSVAESESPASPDGFGTSNYSRVPDDRTTEPNGVDRSVSALRGEETASAPTPRGVGSCDVLVLATLAPEEYFSDPDQDFLTRLSALRSPRIKPLQFWLKEMVFTLYWAMVASWLKPVCTLPFQRFGKVGPRIFTWDFKIDCGSLALVH